MHLCNKIVLFYVITLCIGCVKVLCLAEFETLNPVKSYVTAEDQTKAAEGLIYRIVGNRSDEIRVYVKPSYNTDEYVEVSTGASDSISVMLVLYSFSGMLHKSAYISKDTRVGRFLD